MPIGARRLGPALSHVHKGLLKKPIRRANEGPMAWYKRYKIWMTATEGHRKWKEAQRSKKAKSKKKVKPKKKLTERERRIKARKEAEALLGVKRGVKKPPKKKPIKKKKKK